MKTSTYAAELAQLYARLRALAASDPRPLARIAAAAGLHQKTLQRFVAGQRKTLGPALCEQLAAVYGLRITLDVKKGSRR